MKAAWWTIAAGMAAVLVVMGVQVASAAPAGPAQERPPECHLVHVTNPDGTRFYIRACGTGSGGESWVKDAKWSRSLTADGFTITGSDCGTYANPCVITAPGSPPS